MQMISHLHQFQVILLSITKAQCFYMYFIIVPVGVIVGSGVTVGVIVGVVLLIVLLLLAKKKKKK